MSAIRVSNRLPGGSGRPGPVRLGVDWVASSTLCQETSAVNRLSTIGQLKPFPTSPRLALHQRELIHVTPLAEISFGLNEFQRPAFAASIYIHSERHEVRQS